MVVHNRFSCLYYQLFKGWPEMVASFHIFFKVYYYIMMAH
nr:MAG TPA: hypothetical protein [Caudoviricetes sp.]